MAQSVQPYHFHQLPLGEKARVGLGFCSVSFVAGLCLGGYVTYLYCRRWFATSQDTEAPPPNTGDADRAQLWKKRAEEEEKKVEKWREMVSDLRRERSSLYDELRKAKLAVLAAEAKAESAMKARDETHELNFILWEMVRESGRLAAMEEDGDPVPEDDGMEALRKRIDWCRTMSVAKQDEAAAEETEAEGAVDATRVAAELAANDETAADQKQKVALEEEDARQAEQAKAVEAVRAASELEAKEEKVAPDQGREEEHGRQAEAVLAKTRRDHRLAAELGQEDELADVLELERRLHALGDRQ